MSLPDNVEYRKVAAGHYRVEGYDVVRSRPTRWDVKRGSECVRSFSTFSEAVDWIVDRSDFADAERARHDDQ